VDSLDFFLFVILLVGFAALYVACQIYLIYTLIILMMVAFFYIKIRYPNGKGDWPYGFTDNIYLVGMSNVIMIVFAIVIPEMPLIGSQLTYHAPPWPIGWEIVYSMRDPYAVLMFFIIEAMMWLLVFAILVPYMQRSMSEAASGGGGGKSGEWEKESSKPKIGMGA
jgi:hypothetical protein